MAILPAARILLDFGNAPESAPPHFQQRLQQSQPCRRCDKDQSIQTAVADARETAFAEGREIGRSEQIRSEAEIKASLEVEWDSRTADLARDLFARIDDGLTQICDEITTTTAQLLKTFFQARLKQETNAELAEALRETLNVHSNPKIFIRGPQVLIDQISSFLPADQPAPLVDLLSDTVADVQIIVDRTSVETAIQDWISRLDAIR